MADLDEAVRLDPNSASGYKNRGITFEKKGDTEKALRDFRKAASIDHHNQDAADGIKRLSVAATGAPEKSQEPIAITPKDGANSTADYSGPIPKPGLPPDQIIEEAKAFDRWINDPTRAKPTEVNEALRSSGDIGAKDAQIRTALRSIPKSASQYAEAQKMLAVYAKQDVETRKQLKEAALKYLAAGAELRKTVAKKIQTNYWEAGLDVTASVSGPHSTILNLRYVLFSNPLVYKLVNADAFTDTCRKVGFTKILFSDGYNKSWSYPLNK